MLKQKQLVRIFRSLPVCSRQMRRDNIQRWFLF